MKLTKWNLRELRNEFIDIEINTFIFKDMGREHYAISKFEGVNTGVLQWR